MRNRIFGAIGMVWGGAIVVTRLVGGQPQGAPGSAYASGQSAGFLFGAVLLVVGAYYFFKKPAS